MRGVALLTLTAVASIAPSPANAAERKVGTDAELRAALAALRPGDVVVIAAGTYHAGITIANVAGTEKAPVVIRGADPKDPPLFEGERAACHFSDCSYLTVRGIRVRGSTTNGMNFDDGGTRDGTGDTPSHHITIEDVVIEDTGPRGNRDALKMSGILDFVVRRSTFDGWGGSAIDMVGCKRGVIEDCRFLGKASCSQDNGVQTKGGTTDILVQTNFFGNAGQRAVNIGGSTGLEFFRPKPGAWEAERITVAGNRFTGSVAPVAFVGSDACRVARNTIHLPEKWVLRILQEQTAAGFQPCRGGIFEENLVVTDGRVSVFANVGGGTAPETFTFRRNAWWREDGAAANPQLPSQEKDGVRGVDPKLADAGTATMRVTSKDAKLRGIGADGYEKPK
jgi:hypothetical protein